MNMLFSLSYVAMWILLLIEGVLLVVLYRHFGLAALGTLEGIQRDGLPVGEVVLPVHGMTAAGEAMTWQPRVGHPQMLLFATPDCGPCAQIMPFVNVLAEHHLDLTIIAVVPGPQEGVIRFIEKFRPPFLSLADDGNEAFDRYRVRVTPFAFVIGEEGRILAKGLCSDHRRLRDLLTASGLHDAAVALGPTIPVVQKDSGVTTGVQEVLT